MSSRPPSPVRWPLISVARCSVSEECRVELSLWVEFAAKAAYGGPYAATMSLWACGISCTFYSYLVCVCMQSNTGLSELILEQKYGRQLSQDRATTIVLAHPRERRKEKAVFVQNIATTFLPPIQHHSTFCCLHSSFCLPPSAFHRSAFIIPPSAFRFPPYSPADNNSQHRAALLCSEL